MELNHLRYFYEVAKSGSFTEAARRLRISQSALSKAVALLEDAEGVKLLDRSKRGVSLTSVGAEVYRMSTNIFQTVTDIENTCRGTKEVCKGPLKFGASDHVTNYLLIPHLQSMRAAHPLVTPSVVAGTPNEIVGMILNNELEFGLFFTKVNVPGISYEPIAQLDMAIVCSPGLVPEKKPSMTLAKLRTFVKEVGFIGSPKSQYQKHPAQGFMNLIETNDLTIAYESNSQEAQKRICLQGGGVAFLARFMVEEELSDGRLVELPTKDPLTLELFLARKKSLPLSLNARTFIDLLGMTENLKVAD